ncbi:hypothetical protein JSQ81_02465 [Sporosarcina sp. Marseille-Q4063]|uniref:hypothetical protein n=1 Tax=Sporosarcina sp. Marseille-Q4063 TaxID=2810514 RepID=UPI001BB09397|nr:hypothetical protein [Sporosarcina sp. Marseille-Q4063]QUW22470.1 hypothetical protein JSQ81_02465 [Sporosarcina sp. Marseille-Q4063]
MSYKHELANKISNHYRSSTDAAEEINIVWTEIQTYFQDLNLSLTKEIEMLGDRVNISDDGKIIEFKLGKDGIRFVKEVFDIRVVKITHPNSAELLAVLEFKNNIVVNEADNKAFCESLIDDWVKDAVEVHLS